MMTGPRRIRATALRGVLVGLGVVATLSGRRPRTVAAARVQASPPAPSRALPPASPRARGGRRSALAAGLSGLLLLVGLAGAVVTDRETLFGPEFPATDGARPLAALPPPKPGDAPAAGADAPSAEATAPETPGPDATTTAQAGAESDRAGSARSPDQAEPVRPSGQPADTAGAPLDIPTTVLGIEAGKGGHLPVTGRASAGASVRLSLNDTLIAPATVGRDGAVTFGIERPGADPVRLDRAMGHVRGPIRERAEVPLSAPAPGPDGAPDGSAPGPDPARGGTADSAAGREGPTDPDDPRQPSSTGSLGIASLGTASLNPGSRGAKVAPRTAAGASEVHSGIDVPRIATALVARGDSLWAISRRTYGRGVRYTLIHDANRDRVRDPNLIRPGQILVLPRRDRTRG